MNKRNITVNGAFVTYGKADPNNTNPMTQPLTINTNDRVMVAFIILFKYALIGWFFVIVGVFAFMAGG